MLDGSLLKRIEEKSLLTLKDNYVLVEMSFLSAPNDLYEILFQLKLNGYTIILAHPERYRFLFIDFKEYFKLQKVGCKFQLNLLSVTGYYGDDIAKISNELLRNNLINFVGSDIHSKKHINFMNKRIKIDEIEKLKNAIEANNLVFST